jgi:hypothetical protein
MEYSDIKFIKRQLRYGSTVGLYIGGYFVSQSLVELMWSQAAESLPTLDWSRKQDVKSVFGDKELWLSHKIGARIALGRCLKFFVDHGMLPLREANRGKKGPRRYVCK